MSFECLRAWAGVDWVPGFRQFGPSDVGAMLMPLYTIVRSKKPQRTEFLSGLVKLFDLEPGKKDASLVRGVRRTSSAVLTLRLLQIDVPFLKYVAENLASFHYEKQEEILTVIYTINRVASITSTGVVAFGEKVMHAEGRDDEQIDWEGNEALFMVEASKSMGMLLVLRKFLQSLYKLSHE